MRPTRKRHPEFDPAVEFQYPQHLREAMDDLPSAPGVYIFHGDSDILPLYIGKSVNIRNRVLSHLRNEEEARLLRQTKRISHIRTAGEIGALLLEASLIKQKQPLYNQKLRRTKQLCSWMLTANGAEVVYSRDVNFATQTGLFGLFASKRAALEAMQTLADQNKLCNGEIGLERLPASKACFRFGLRMCAGACCGKESKADHRNRLMKSLEGIQVECWPFPGPVGLVERFDGDYQMHVIAHWCYLGSVVDPKDAKALVTQAAGFDADGYKILCRPILGGSAEVVPLW